MKSRPRSVEREVAYWLSVQFKEQGFAPVERIPVLGRIGPDISINELGLVIDVKSRLSVPIGVIVPPGKTILWNKMGYLGTRLSDIAKIYDDFHIQTYDFRLVANWFEHMDQWRRHYFPEGITTLVLHRPGSWVRNATFIIHVNDKDKFYDRYNQRNHDLRIPAELKSQSLGGIGRFTPGYS